MPLVPIFHVFHTDPVFLVNAYFHYLPMISGSLSPIPQNSTTKTTAWHKKFSHISHNFVNKMRLVPFSHIFHSDPVFLVNASFHYLPMISGSLSPIPQNSITKTTVWHKKFFHISDNFVNQMQLVPIFHIWHRDPISLVCLFSSFTYDFWKSDSYSRKLHHKDYSLAPKVFSHLSQFCQ